ncbi:3-isopropylmalate dehydrogenase [Striga asiatica]|uniref:3-isopropylmalate dehydrogenase n=1 Tax=Striga asiatica TaxID=4170 RepID=A0A5A7PUM0_STRAF|nr:3-isopropylmalate dehydrogenase [Striga asiatica]
MGKVERVWPDQMQARFRETLVTRGKPQVGSGCGPLVTGATDALLLDLVIVGLDLLVTALRDLGSVVRFGRGVDEAEGGVFVGSKGGERVVAGEIEGGVERVVASHHVWIQIGPEREKGAKETLEGWLGTESAAEPNSGGTQPSGLNGTASTSKLP